MTTTPLRSLTALPEVPSTHELSPADREHFGEWVDELEERSLALARDARSLTWPQLQGRMDELSVSCNSCYRCFQGLPNVEWNPPGLRR